VRPSRASFATTPSSPAGPRAPSSGWWALFNLLVAGALNFFNVIRIGDNAYLGSLLAGLWGIAVLLPYLAVAVRRLRDAGYGWGHLFWILVPIAGIFVLITLWAQPTKPAVPATTAATA
jgi:uncharacterized membrane protein YhaH (DUF805 family)